MVQDEPSTRAPSIESFIRLRQRRTVVLPQPDGPISAVISFRQTGSSRRAPPGSRRSTPRARRRRTRPRAPLLSASRWRSTAAPSDRRRSSAVSDASASHLVTSISFTTFVHIGSSARSRAEFIRRSTTISTTIAAAVSAWNFSLGWRATSRRSIVGSAVYGPCSFSSEGPRSSREEPRCRPHQDQGRRLSERPRQRQHRARQDPGRRVGQHVAAHHLPPGRPDAVPGLADALGNGPQRLGRRDDHDRQHQDRQRQPARDEAAAHR